MRDYSTLKKKLKIESFKKLDDGAAHLTHYLHNYKNGVSQSYKGEATKFYNELREELNLIKDPELQDLLPLKWDIPFPAPLKIDYTFIDVFAGIGGFRIPMQELNGKCVFSCEYNYHAQRTYELNFGEV